jgi:hypothetical protein
MSSNTVLHTYEVPQCIKEAALREIQNLAKKAVPRLLVIVTLLLGTLYLFFKNIAPDELDFNWNKAFLELYLISVGLIVFTFIVQPWLMKFGRTVYIVSEKGMRRQGSPHAWFLKWSAIESYNITRREPFPEIQVVTLNTRRNTRQILLSDGPLADEIIDTVAAYVGIQATPVIDLAFTGEEPSHKLSKAQYAVLYFITAVYSIVLSYYLDLCFMNGTNRDMAPLLLFSSLCLGGGTIGMMILFGPKVFKEKQLVSHIIIFNFVSFALTMFFCVLLIFYHLSELVKKL